MSFAIVNAHEVDKIEWRIGWHTQPNPGNQVIETSRPGRMAMTKAIFRNRPTPVTERRTVSVRSAKVVKADSPRDRAEQTSGHWTFLTNHCHVLILLALNPSIVLRKVAAMVGITERAVQRIIADLQGGGFIERQKVGRQNHYRIIRERKLRHAVEAHRTIGDLLRIIDGAR